MFTRHICRTFRGTKMQKRRKRSFEGQTCKSRLNSEKFQNFHLKARIKFPEKKWQLRLENENFGNSRTSADVSLNFYLNLARSKDCSRSPGSFTRGLNEFHGNHERIKLIGISWRLWSNRTLAWNCGIDFSISNFRYRARILSWKFFRFLVSSLTCKCSFTGITWLFDKVSGSWYESNRSVDPYSGVKNMKGFGFWVIIMWKFGTKIKLAAKT